VFGHEVTPAQNDALRLTAPGVVDNGGMGPVPVSFDSHLHDVRKIAFLVPKNPYLLASVYTLPKGTLPHIDNQLKVGYPTGVLAVAEAGGKLYRSPPRNIFIQAGGCGGSAIYANRAIPKDSVRLRADAKGDQVTVKSLFMHPMFSGFSHTANGHPIPAHYIQTVEFRADGRPVLFADWGPTVSRFPYLAFAYRWSQGGKGRGALARQRGHARQRDDDRDLIRTLPVRRR
jgi:Predicted secreted protein